MSFNISVEFTLEAPYLIAPSVTIQSILASFKGRYTSSFVSLVTSLFILVPQE
jgi:hypothetical protein